METEFAKYKQIGDMIQSHGQDFITALFILVVGLIAIKYLNKLFKYILERFTFKPQMVYTVNNIICIILLFLIVAVALQHLGMATIIIRRVLFLISLAVIGIIAIFRPLIPSLPFKVGNTVKIGNLLGKIEGTTILNTRMKTFDGKTVFIPNTKILNDFVINYHFTNTRRIKVDISIRYDQDILKAKQILESIMIEDPRALLKPRPVVYVLNMIDNCIKLGGDAGCTIQNTGRPDAN